MSIFRNLERIADALEKQNVLVNDTNTLLKQLLSALTSDKPDIAGIGVTESPPVVRPGA